ncbi:MAG: TetR/AcrR family transcriptional regulator, partial [Actinobacteria bacterium]|nr:TetR/AcrR family transcriptional regulator [Actinomycetota bacterium]
ATVEEQEALDRNRMIELIEDGVASGDFSPADPYSACVRIFMAIDGFGSYVNDPVVFEHTAFTHFVSDTVSRELGVPNDRLRAEIDRIER